MKPEDLKARTKAFAVKIIEFSGGLPKTRVAEIIGKQLVRSATSVGANYRAACRARSQADFISKITIVEEEADETLYWLELIAESGISTAVSVKELMQEADELTAIFTAAGKTAKQNRR